MKRTILGLLIVLIALQAQPTIHGQSAPLEPLALPSFSIFDFSPEKTPAALEQMYQAGNLAGILSGFDKVKATASASDDEAVRARAQGYKITYFVLPIVFYASRHLFSKEDWTAEELKEGQQLSAYIAQIAQTPDLTIESTEPRSFRRGLVRLRNWFVALSHDNKTLPALMFSSDDLFYGGEDIDIVRFPELKLVESTPIQDQRASFVILTDGKKPEPMIIGVQNSDGKVRWLKRFSGQSAGEIADVMMGEDGITKLDGYGYICRLLASWTYGTEGSRVYLDESLNLRFYYVSW